MSEEQGEKVPIWVISFTDMVTLMLAFFVMLQTLAKEKSKILFRAGQGSFIRQAEGFGIPDLILGKPKMPDVDYHKIKYPSPQADTTDARPHRVIDAEGDQIKKAYEELTRLLRSTTGDIPDRVLSSLVTPIRFANPPNLDRAATDYLDALVAGLRQNSREELLTIRVIGLPAGAQAGEDPRALAAKRAKAVEDYLRPLYQRNFPAAKTDIYSYGVTHSSQLPAAIAPAAEKASIVIILTGAQNG